MKGKKYAKGGAAKSDMGADVKREAEGSEPDERDTKKRGGKVEGKAARKRLDRPGRKNGGKIGADKRPATEAQRVSKPAGRSIMKDGMEP